MYQWLNKPLKKPAISGGGVITLGGCRLTSRFLSKINVLPQDGQQSPLFLGHPKRKRKDRLPTTNFQGLLAGENGTVVVSNDRS